MFRLGRGCREHSKDMNELSDFIFGVSGMACTLAVMLFAFAKSAEKKATKMWFILAVVFSVLGSRKVVLIPNDVIAVLLRSLSFAATLTFFHSMWKLRTSLAAQGIYSGGNEHR